MGEIADGLINGDFDFYTGEYLGKGYGIPRTKNKSLEWERKDFTKSKEAAFKGVKKSLYNKLGVKDITDIVNEYMPGTDKSLKQKCLEIQKDWLSFSQWVNKKIKQYNQ